MRGEMAVRGTCAANARIAADQRGGAVVVALGLKDLVAFRCGPNWLMAPSTGHTQRGITPVAATPGFSARVKNSLKLA
jgi:hypothetical protein